MNHSLSLNSGIPFACDRTTGIMTVAASVYTSRPAEEPTERRWAPGRRVGRYQVLRHLGAGAFGLTVLARRSGPRASRFQKLVALKIMKPEHAKDREFTLRMLDEAKLQAELRHDQLVDVYDFRKVEGDLVLEMEYVDGLTLSQYLRSFAARRVPTRVAAYLVSRVLRGLSWMHEAQDDASQPLHLVHRDIKPSNIFVGRAGAIKIGDFGLVRGRGRHFETAVAGDARILGTPRYMAPEQCQAGAVDGRVDVYAVGVMFYEMLSAGMHPANHHLIPNEYEALVSTLSAERTPIRSHVPSLPEPLAELVDAMVARDPARRPTASAALAELLQVVPMDTASEELALQRSVAAALRRSGASAAPRQVTAPSTAADEPTEFFRAESTDQSMALARTRPAPKAGAAREGVTRTRTRVSALIAKVPSPAHALGASLALFAVVLVLAIVRAQ